MFYEKWFSSFVWYITSTFTHEFFNFYFLPDLAQGMQWAKIIKKEAMLIWKKTHYEAFEVHTFVIELFFHF